MGNNRESFLKEGFLHLRSFISQNDCQSLILRMRELAFRLCPKKSANVFLTSDKGQSKDDFFLASANKISFFFDPNAKEAEGFKALNKVGHALHELCPVYQRFSSQNKFYDLMHDLGQNRPALIQSMFIFKQPLFGDAVPAHQDATFLYTVPHSTIGLWFALEDADENNGCLWVLPQRHQGPLKNRFVNQAGSLSFTNERHVSWPKKDYIPLRVKAGDAVVLHGFLPHFSEQNKSSKTRYAYTLHFIDKSCHYPKTNWLASFTGGLEQARK